MTQHYTESTVTTPPHQGNNNTQNRGLVPENHRTNSAIQGLVQPIRCIDKEHSSASQWTCTIDPQCILAESWCRPTRELVTGLDVSGLLAVKVSLSSVTLQGLPEAQMRSSLLLLLALLVAPAAALAQKKIPKAQGHDQCPLGYVNTLGTTCVSPIYYEVEPTNGKACKEGWMNVGAGYCRKKWAAIQYRSCRHRIGTIKRPLLEIH